MDANLEIVFILTFGFALASLLGYFAKQIKLPTILGFLLAGYLIGPNSPGIVADLRTAEQLAEIGVILMLFSVGLHFKVEDLFKVKKIAIPGAILQTATATIATIFLTKQIGWSIQSGTILGIGIGVASTFVMARVLSDYKILDTKQGHIAIGWLVVEDVFTVIALVLLPLLAKSNTLVDPFYQNLLGSILIVCAKFLLLCLLAFTFGYKAVNYLLKKIAQSRSQELFTVAVLSIIFLIATISSAIFGASLALGAFIAGMVIGKTNIKHHVAAHSIPLKDVFTIIFFLSIGMLLNPLVIKTNLFLFIGVIGIVLILKPLSAFLLILTFRLPIKVALTIGFALGQIGEFSFILAEQATFLKLLPSEGFDVIVCCSFLSICLNPLLFRSIDFLEILLQKIPFFSQIHKKREEQMQSIFQSKRSAVIVGYGPIGQEVAHSLKEYSYFLTVIENNIDTVEKHSADVRILYGDVSFKELLEEADVAQAKILVITIPEIETAQLLIEYARELNPSIRILTRVQYISEIDRIQDLGVQYVCSEIECKKSFKLALDRLCHDF